MLPMQALVWKIFFQNHAALSNLFCKDADKHDKYVILTLLSFTSKIFKSNCDTTKRSHVIYNSKMRPRRFQKYFAKKGYLGCMIYAYENGCPWDRDTCSTAAMYGHVDCLKFAHEKGCLLDERTIEYAIYNGNFDCLKYALASLRNYSKTLNMNLGNAEVNGVIIECCNKILASDENNLVSHILKTQALLALKQYKQAIESCDEIILKHSAINSMAHEECKAQALFGMKQYGQAIEYYTEVLRYQRRVNPSRNVEAIECCNEVLSRDIHSIEARLCKADALLRENKFSEASICWDELLTYDNKNIEWQLNSAQTLFALLEYKQVIMRCQKIMELDPKNKRARALIVRTCNRILSEDDNDIDAYRYTAHALISMNENLAYARAIECCDRIISYNKDDIDAYRCKAHALIGTKYYKRAVEILQKIPEFQSPELAMLHVLETLVINERTYYALSQLNIYINCRPLDERLLFVSQFLNIMRARSSLIWQQRVIKLLKEIVQRDLFLEHCGEFLGAGSYGHVWKFYSGRIHKPNVVLKIPYDNNCTTMVEACLLGDIVHENIVKIYSTRYVAGRQAICLEYAERGSLHDILHEKKENFDRLRCIIQIANGMHYLQSKGILHRDLKSANVLVTKDFTVKIGDFGLATNIEQHKMDDQYCVSQFYPSYAAPEVQNEGKYYRQSDVYSFGILVWEIITRQRPPMTLPNIITEPFWKQLVEKCTQTDYKIRPSFEEIIQSLDLRMQGIPLFINGVEAQERIIIDVFNSYTEFTRYIKQLLPQESQLAKIRYVKAENEGVICMLQNSFHWKPLTQTLNVLKIIITTGSEH